MYKKAVLLIREIRLYQWVKNLLVFIPVLGAHRVADWSILSPTILSFFAFCFASSCIYVINDLCDLQVDRVHSLKQRRPFASGELALHWSIPLILVFGTGAGIICFALPRWFIVALVAYVLGSLTYSLGLKRAALLDVFILAFLYIARLAGGHLATKLPFSPWMIGFCLFFFLGLAFLKRYTELYYLIKHQRINADGRGYTVNDLEAMRVFGIVSGYISVLVFALYINSNEVRLFYRKPAYLWVNAPLLLLWLSRMWLAAQRGNMTVEPVLFALRDRAGYAIAVCCFAFFIMALFG